MLRTRGWSATLAGQPALQMMFLLTHMFMILIATFLGNFPVLSRKDQAQYWYWSKPYNYVSIDQFVQKFKESDIGQKLSMELLEPLDASQTHKDAVSFSIYSLSKWELLKACMSREMLLVRRNSFVYIFKTVQVNVRIQFFICHTDHKQEM